MLRTIRKWICRPTAVNDRAYYLGLLSGEGIEIGALQNPAHAPHLRVRYVDRLPRAALLEQYPELRGQPVVDPDILDDAESLEAIATASQDFVIANHVIEHMANPIRALIAWSRVLRPGGRLFLAVPDKRFTFDKARPCTTLDHLIEDYEHPSPERDREHFIEFAREVSCRVFNARPIEEAEAYAEELIRINYSIHYHVWDDAGFNLLLDTMAQRYQAWEMRVLDAMPAKGNEFIIVLEKVNARRR